MLKRSCLLISPANVHHKIYLWFYLELHNQMLALVHLSPNLSSQEHHHLRTKENILIMMQTKPQLCFKMIIMVRPVCTKPASFSWSVRNLIRDLRVACNKNILLFCLYLSLFLFAYSCLCETVVGYEYQPLYLCLQRVLEFLSV